MPRIEIPGDYPEIIDLPPGEQVLIRNGTFALNTRTNVVEVWSVFSGNCVAFKLKTGDRIPYPLEGFNQELTAIIVGPEGANIYSSNE